PARSPALRQPTILIVGNPAPFLQPAPGVGAPAVSAAPLIAGVAEPSEAESSAPSAVPPAVSSQVQAAAPALVRASDADNDDERQAGRRGERRDTRRKSDQPRAQTDEREGPET